MPRGLPNRLRRLQRLHAHAAAGAERRLPSLVALAIALALPSSAPAQSIAPAVVQRVDPAVACVESRSPKSGRLVGSGFVIAPGILATSAHQLGSRSDIKVHFPGTAPRRAVLIGRSDVTDIALLGADTGDVTALQPATEPPSAGSDVFTIGCPLDLEHSLTKGTISNAGRLVDGMRMIQVALDINHGNSGGPLLDREGRVIGLVVGFLRNAKAIDFAAPIDEVLALMERVAHGRDPSDRTLGTLWARAQSADSATGRVAAYRAVVEKAPWLAEGWYNLGRASYETGDFAAAATAFRTAVAQRPRYHQAYTNLGLALYRMGRHEEARDALQRSIAIDKSYALAWLDLGIVYREGLQDRTAATQAFRRYLDLAPNAPEAAEIRRWLQ